MEDKKKYEHPKCFLPEKGNPYPLCIGQGKPECEECQLRADWEPEDPQFAQGAFLTIRTITHKR